MLKKIKKNNLSFTKMHGLGNDFIVIDNRENQLKQLDILAQKLCKRKFGIGADQILLLENSNIAGYYMKIFNPDGSQAQMCGNGIRCLAKFIRDNNISDKEQLHIETQAGIIKTKWLDEQVEVDMGRPILDADKIPVKQTGRLINAPLTLDDISFNITCVSMGNPHCIIIVDNLAGIPLSKYGTQIERHPLFPQRINVEFVQIINKQEISVKVWERGAGETLACGTGACASAVAAVLNNRTGRRLTVHLPGGMLKIHWSGQDNRVYMRGPAETVFEGTILL